VETSLYIVWGLASQVRNTTITVLGIGALMKPETKNLLERCRTALLQQSDTRIALLLTHWFENMIGEEWMDEALDDLCLLLNYRVQTWGAQKSYATYTSWWEVEGYLEPAEGTFFCADVPSLRKRLLDMPVKPFDQVVELAYQARSESARPEGEGPLLTGPAGLREMAVWLADPHTGSEYRERQMLPRGSLPSESQEARRRRENEWVKQACQLGYLFVYPDTSQAVKNSFRRWCEQHAHPYLWIETCAPYQTTLRAQTKTVNVREVIAVLARFREQMPQLSTPYLTRAQKQGYQARLIWISRHQVALEGILAEDVEAAARKVVALWSGILAEERKKEVEQEAERLAAREPMWKRELKRWREQGQQPELPFLSEKVELPSDWDDLFTREQLSIFLNLLEPSAHSRDSKAVLVQMVGTLLQTDQTARAMFFEAFKRELAVAPWEVETFLKCTPTERKRWTEEGKLSVVDQRSFRKAGSWMVYPVFDRRILLCLSQVELDQWRAEHQILVKEHRRAGAQAASQRRGQSSRQRPHA
jgi:hypothetical protein